PIAACSVRFQSPKALPAVFRASSWSQRRPDGASPGHPQVQESGCAPRATPQKTLPTGGGSPPQNGQGNFRNDRGSKRNPAQRAKAFFGVLPPPLCLPNRPLLSGYRNPN